jgi:hypothetical protein
MNRIRVNKSLGAKLDAVAEPVEVVDESGRTLGHFLPVPPLGASDGCPYSISELHRMRLEDGGRSLTEIWESLGAR